MKLGRHTYDWRRVLRRNAGKVVLGLVVMAGLLYVSAMLEVHATIMGGAIQKPVFSCIDEPHLDRRAELVMPMLEGLPPCERLRERAAQPSRRPRVL